MSGVVDGRVGSLVKDRLAASSRLLRTAAAGGVGLGLALAATQVSAFWSASSTPGSSGGAATSSVPAGATPAVSVVDRNDLQVTWDRTTLDDGTPATGYVVTRHDQSGTTIPATGGCAGTVTTTSCTEADVPDGLWTYRVVPRYQSWSGRAGDASASALADITPPSHDISLQNVSGGIARVGADTFYYRGAAAGSFQLVNALSDAGSGPAQSVTGVLSGSTTGWSHTASSVSTPAGGPYVSNLFSWTAGSTSEPTVGISGIDAYGNVAPTSRTFLLDNIPPTGGAVDYTDGVVSTPGSATSTQVRVTVGDVSDARSGVASRVLQRRTATLSGNTCGTFGGWVDDLQNPDASNLRPVSIGTCYQYRYLVTDAVGNQLTAISGNQLKVRSYQSVITGTSGLVGYWRLGETGGSSATATRGSSGTYVNGPTRGQAGAIAGDDDTSVFFDGQDDYVRISRPVSTTFTVEFWMRTTQNPAVNGDANQWYSGAGLVDGEVAGVANDFGISLMNGGRVGAGTGNPDRTAISNYTVNDGSWHHVVMTRNGGTVLLYVDGQQRASSTGGNTAALTAPASIDFGRLQTGINHYRGNLDEVAFYNQVLSASTVDNHYRSGLP